MNLTTDQITVDGDTQCPICLHRWSHHDPEDGRCDSYSDEQPGVCQCGRDLDWMRTKIAMLAHKWLTDPRGHL